MQGWERRGEAWDHELQIFWVHSFSSTALLNLQHQNFSAEKRLQLAIWNTLYIIIVDEWCTVRSPVMRLCKENGTIWKWHQSTQLFDRTFPLKHCFYTIFDARSFLCIQGFDTWISIQTTNPCKASKDFFLFFFFFFFFSFLHVLRCSTVHVMRGFFPLVSRGQKGVWKNDQKCPNAF